MKIPNSILITVTLLLALCFASYSTAQQTVTQQQALTALQKAYLALLGRSNLSDVKLTGTARRIAGLDDETGNVTVTAILGTGSRIDLTFPSGTRNEIRNIAGSVPLGSWSGPDGISHAMPYHNLLTDPGLCPAFVLARFVTDPGALLSYKGFEDKSGSSSVHVTAAREQFGSAVPIDTSTQHLSQTEIFLDSKTFLPLAVNFSIHPDNNAGIDIPIEVQFSQYYDISGVLIPFHVQKFLNNGLVLDLQFDNAVVNSGIAPSLFAVSAE